MELFKTKSIIVHRQYPRIIHEIKANIPAEVIAIQPNLLKKGVEIVAKRARFTMLCSIKRPLD